MRRVFVPQLYFPFIAVAVFATIVVGTATFAHAQSVPGTDPLTLDVDPSYPTPYQTITVTPSSTLFDMASSVVTMNVNGTPYYKGTGGAGISVQLGGPGTSTTIVVTATVSGQSYKKSVTVVPASVALVQEPISTTHAFYAGEGLVSPEGRVRLVAIPDLRTASGKQLDPSTLIYTWKFGDQVLEGDSGIGQSVLSATAPERYRDAPVSVTVASPDNSIIAQAQTTVSPVDPVVHLYRNDPLLGPLFDTALSDTVTLSGDEDTYRGVGYYFAQTPTIDWTVNGTDSGSDPDITVRSTGSGTGSALLNFTATDDSTSQTSNESMTVNFGQKQSLGLFGL